MRDQQNEGGQDAAVDLVFDVPLLLAKELTGFKHDEQPTVFERAPTAFRDLSAPMRGRPWWKVW